MARFDCTKEQLQPLVVTLKTSLIYMQVPKLQVRSFQIFPAPPSTDDEASSSVIPSDASSVYVNLGAESHGTPVPLDKRLRNK
jgi:hypothetical protein